MVPGARGMSAVASLSAGCPRVCQVSPSVLSCQSLSCPAYRVPWIDVWLPGAAVAGTAGLSAPVATAFCRLPHSVCCLWCHSEDSLSPPCPASWGAWLWLPVASSALWEVTRWAREGAPGWEAGAGVQRGCAEHARDWGGSEVMDVGVWMLHGKGFHGGVRLEPVLASSSSCS